MLQGTGKVLKLLGISWDPDQTGAALLPFLSPPSPIFHHSDRPPAGRAGGRRA